MFPVWRMNPQNEAMATQSSFSFLHPRPETKYLWLLISLIGFILLIPLYRELSFHGEIYALDALLLVIMILGVRAACQQKVLRAVGTLLWIVAFGLEMSAILIGEGVQPEPTLALVSRLLLIAASTLLTILIVRDVFSGNISRDQLRGAGCAYLMMGVAFGLVFAVIERLAPGSFQVSDAITQATERTTGDAQTLKTPYLNYYSFVTLTTLGYGDISPVRPFAQSAAYLSACIGQFYLTVLVAFLVGMRLAQVTSTEQRAPA